MPLARLKPTDNGKQWGDIAEASYVVWKVSAHTELDALTEELKAYFNDSELEIMGLVTVLKCGHQVVIVQKGCASSLHSLKVEKQSGTGMAAFTDILYFIRNDFGSKSGTWGNGDCLNDENLSSVLQHFTFAGFAAADIGYHTKLNNTYEKYQIQAWDFVHHKDQTNQAHVPWFNTWRGHRYELPAEIVDHFASEFGPRCHGIEGYAQAAEWMYRRGGGDMVRSQYSY
ncbi:hypothetical protein EG328_010737 [Venturia inaequalis]|uniref:Uncharacterized protein n=1 Tax=Venturia inaequalis TaxID=5025 RepID=A0A8H3U767_VENIN|nr:hypothetical protein EG328_010737 [Venturia inaequalis]